MSIIKDRIYERDDEMFRKMDADRYTKKLSNKVKFNFDSDNKAKSEEKDEKDKFMKKNKKK